MARQPGGAGRAASVKHPPTFLLQDLVVSVLTPNPFTRAQCQAESGLYLKKQCVLPAFHGQGIQIKKKREILQWGETQREAITITCSNRFLGSFDFCFEH